jgi:protein SCO1/2
MSERDSHESYEVFAGRLHWIAVIIVGSLIAIIWLMYELAHTWLAPLPRIEPLAPPGRPRLQAYPSLELQTVLAQEREALHQYQWVDREHGIARIPIERAMEIMANGASNPTASPAGATPDPMAAPPPPSSPGYAGAAQRQRHAADRTLARPPPPPPDLDRRAGIDQRIGQSLPGDLVFHDTDGRPLHLAELDNGKPLLLAFGYFGCPNLCDTQLHSMAKTIASLPLRAGKDFQVAFVSIDPTENPRAAARAATQLSHDSPGARVDQWHLLTGDATNIATLASAVGVRYWLDPKLGQYVHPAGIIITTNAACVAQYFFGVSFPPDAVRLALVSASNGHLGTVIDQLVLLCCGYDPTTGRYSLLIGRVALIVCSLFLIFIIVWLWHMKRSAR